MVSGNSVVLIQMMNTFFEEFGNKNENLVGINYTKLRIIEYDGDNINLVNLPWRVLLLLQQEWKENKEVHSRL